MKQSIWRKIDRAVFVAAIVMCALAAAATPWAARAQSNVTGTLLASAARTVTTSSSDVNNTSYRGAHILVNVTSFTSGTWVLTVEGKDPVSATYYTICTGPTISATGLTIVKVYPGLFATVDGATIIVSPAVCGDFLPRTWRITMTGATSPSATFSVGYLGEF